MTDREQSSHFRSADGRFGLFLPEAVVEELFRICLEADDIETGGILIGRYTEDRALAIVDQVTGPPPDSKHFFARFQRGVAGLQLLLNRMWSKQEKRFYLGEWHYHTLPDPRPSMDDTAQMKEIAESDRYACPEPILLIVAGSPSAVWQFSATVHPRNEPAVPMPQSPTHWVDLNVPKCRR